MEVCNKFLKLLDPNTDQFLFCCYHETNKSAKGFIIKGTLEANYSILQKINKDGYGIYVAVNAQEGKSRTKQSMLYPRAIYQDDDKQFKGRYPLAPNVLVNTSQGKYQRYWLFTAETWSQEMWREYEDIEHTLVKQYGNDPSTTDCSRVLRLPGFYNMKKPATPYLITFEIAHEVYYTYEQIKEAFPPTEQPKVEQPKLNKPNKLVTALNQVLSGENFNDALGTLSMHLIDKKYPKEFVLATLQGIMLQSQEKDSERWAQRYEHLERQVTAGIEKKNKEVTVFPPHPGFNAINYDICSELPWPKGLLNDLAQDILDSMRNPEPNIALLGALHIFSTFAGRTFQYEKLGLTAKRLLIAKSGRGKNIVKTYLNELVTEFGKPGLGGIPLAPNARLFVSQSGKYTTASALHELLQASGNLSLILSEAGLAEADKSDYKGGNKAYLLQLLTEPQTSAIMPEVQRHNPLEPVYERCAVFMSETTMERVLSQLQDTTSWLDGDFPRQDIVFADPIISPTNRRSATHSKSTSVKTALAKLVRMNTIMENTYKGTIPVSQSDLRIVSDTDEVFEFFNDEEEKRRTILNTPDCPVHTEALYNRRIIKMKIYAMIYAIADTLSNDNDLSQVVIQLHHAEWARDLLDEFKRPLLELVEAGALSAPDEQFYRLVEERIVRLLLNYETRDEPRSTLLRSYNLIPRSELSTHLSRPVNDFLKSNPNVRVTLDTALIELMNRGILEQLSQEEKMKLGSKHNILATSLSGKVYRYNYDPKSVQLTPLKRKDGGVNKKGRVNKNGEYIPRGELNFDQWQWGDKDVE